MTVDARTLAKMIFDAMRKVNDETWRSRSDWISDDSGDRPDNGDLSDVVIMIHGIDLTKVAADVLRQLEQRADNAAPLHDRTVAPYGRQTMMTLAELEQYERAEMDRLRAENADLKALLDGKMVEASNLSRDELMAVFGKRDPLIARLREENQAYEAEIARVRGN